ncbi:MAG: TPM domain-containing protein [Ruminococcus sp.]|nr:TPM domain-containing protein [Ruminococcus sp.]
MKKALTIILKYIIAIVALIFLAGLVVRIRPVKGNLRVPFDSRFNFSELYDTADLFDSTQEKELRKEIIACSEELEMNIIVYINDVYRSDEEVEDFTANYYDRCAGEEYTDGVIMYIDISSNAYDYLSCSGKAGIIYGGKIEDIFDYYAAKRPSSQYAPDPEKFCETVTHFCNAMRKFNDNYEQADFAYEKDEENGIYFFNYKGKFYVTDYSAPGSRRIRLECIFILGLVLYTILYLSIKKKYKFKDKTNPSIYVANGQTNFKEKSDTFIRVYTTKHKIESSSSGGGHRSGGGHSGGHVGGGRHF